MPVYEEKDSNKITKDGRKYYFMCCYKDKYGNNKRYKSKKYKGVRECEKAERDFLTNTEKKDLTDYNITFKDVYSEWLEFYKVKIKSSTYYSIKKRTEKHIVVFFENYKLHSIKINSIIEWLEYMDKKELCDDYKNNIIGYLQEILNYAVNNYDFDIKVASKLQKRKIEAPVNKPKDSETNYWTLEEFNIFIKEVDDFGYKVLFTFLYYTGLRIGEMSALTWNDIDLEKKELTINKSYTNKIGGGYKITTTKTSNSNRIIELNDDLVKLLKTYKNAERKIETFNDDFFVFGNITYLPQNTIRNNLDYYINKVRETNSNFKRITPHGFRHSHASLLIHLGCDSRDVANRLGDTVQMVESTYYHMFPSKKSVTVNALNKLNEEKQNSN